MLHLVLPIFKVHVLPISVTNLQSVTYQCHELLKCYILMLLIIKVLHASVTNFKVLHISATKFESVTYK